MGLTLLTGFSGLVYELTWEKVLATLLGSHSEATAAVLGLFLGGLAAGAAIQSAGLRGGARSPPLIPDEGAPAPPASEPRPRAGEAW